VPERLEQHSTIPLAGIYRGPAISASKDRFPRLERQATGQCLFRMTTQAVCAEDRTNRLFEKADAILRRRRQQSQHTTEEHPGHSLDVIENMSAYGSVPGRQRAYGYTRFMHVPVAPRLGLMMFLNYVIWGTWYVTLGTYLTQTLNFSGTQAGAVFGTAALSCMISPFFVGLVADRFFAAERVLCALHLIGAALLYLVAQATTFIPVYVLLLTYCLCYFPTISLTNSLTLRNVRDGASEFPRIRMFATIGWIVIGVIIGSLEIEKSAVPFLIAAGCSVLMAGYCLTLPHTPPQAKGQTASWRTILGLDALVMMRNRSYAVFVIASVLACIPLTFYFSFTNAYLNEAGVSNAAGKMTLGQVSEIGMMLLMPFIYRRFRLKAIFLAGLAAWSLRYVFLAFGNAAELSFMFYAAILLHGICFDFFFMTGQLYTDQEAPARLRGTAQGFYMFLTYGLGMFLGSMLSGWAVDFFTTNTGTTVVRNWTSFWLSSAASAFLILLLIAVKFQSRGRIEAREAAPVAAD
jgi:nucleoside transporter